MAETKNRSFVSIIQSSPAGDRGVASEPGADDLPVDEPLIETSSVPPPGRLTRQTIFLAMSAAIGLLALWFIVFGFILTDLQTRSAQTRLYEKFRLQLAEETAPLAEPVKVGSPVAVITADHAGIHDLVVIEGTTSRLLEAGPGHLSDTPLPGQVGDSVLLGRSVTYGAPFRHITEMKPGQMLTVTTGQGAFEYQVEDVRLPGTPLPRPLQPDESRLTLVTSGGSGWLGSWAPAHTVYLDALLIHGRAQLVPTGVPSSVSEASKPMQGDPSGLVAFIFWMEGFLFAGFAMVWSWGRWGRYRSWLVGTPVMLVVLWQASNAVMRFLPNLL